MNKPVTSDQQLDWNNRSTVLSSRNAMYGNRNAMRKEKRVELGWIHEGRQVRTRMGGGTRKFVMPKIATKDYILKVALDAFFPEGRSTKGPLEMFHIDLTDFNEIHVPDNMTMGDMYSEVRHNVLRLYLRTTLICH